MNSEDKKKIYEAFLEGALEVKSVSLDKRVEWKPVMDVMRHDVSAKRQFRIGIEKGIGCSVTCDHSLFRCLHDTIEAVRTDELNVGDDLVYVEDKVISRKLLSKLQIPSIPFMYDLSVQDNENFILESGILAHNSFRPPASMKFVQGQTQVFGFIWEDEELIEYIYMAIDDFNTRPPVTDLVLAGLWGSERRWRTAILLRAAAFACFAIAMNWIADEFSVNQDEIIRVQDENGDEYALTVKELFDLIYGDRIRSIEEPTMEETRRIIEEMRNDDIKASLRVKK